MAKDSSQNEAHPERGRRREGRPQQRCPRRLAPASRAGTRSSTHRKRPPASRTGHGMGDIAGRSVDAPPKSTVTNVHRRPPR